MSSNNKINKTEFVIAAIEGKYYYFKQLDDDGLLNNIKNLPKLHNKNSILHILIGSIDKHNNIRIKGFWNANKHLTSELDIEKYGSRDYTEDIYINSTKPRLEILKIFFKKNNAYSIFYKNKQNEDILNLSEKILDSLLPRVQIVGDIQEEDIYDAVLDQSQNNAALKHNYKITYLEEIIKLIKDEKKKISDEASELINAHFQNKTGRDIPIKDTIKKYLGGKYKKKLSKKKKYYKHKSKRKNST